MRKFTFFLALILVFAFMGTAMAREDTVIPISGKPVGNRPYIEFIDEDDMSSNSPYAVPTQQSVKAYVDDAVSIGASSANVVLIDSVDDLSTWADATAGSSYFQTEAGKIYIVDPIAIVASGTAPTSGVSKVAFSGVTAHLPLATSANNYETVEIMWGRASSGTSTTPIAFTVQVWPAPLSGTTKFRADGAITGSQNLAGMATAGVSTFAIGVVGSYNIDAIGDTMEWRLFYDSAVSAQPTNRYMP